MVRQWHLNIGAMALFAVGLTALFFSSVGDSHAAPSLVVNGNFDADALNWSNSANGTIAHAPLEDADADPPGAGLVTYTGTGAGIGWGASDCIAATPGAYDLQYSYSEPVQIPAPQVSIDVVVWALAGCTGVPTVAAGSVPVNPTAGVWANDFNPAIVTVTTELSIEVRLMVHGSDAGEQGLFDKVALSNGTLDTPTPTPTSTATNTPTSTPTATNTPSATPTETGTPEPTSSPFPTHTPTGTSTPVPPPPATSTPEPVVETVIDDTGAPPEASFGDGVGAGGESPEQGVGAEGEQPEGSEFPSSGTGPGSYGNDDSTPANVIATFAFALAIGMLGTGFYLRKKYENAE